MIGKEIKYRIKKARMSSARIKCTASMAHSCTSSQSCMELTRGPSCFMTWSARVHPFARSTVRKSKQKICFCWDPWGKEGKFLSNQERKAEESITFSSFQRWALGSRREILYLPEQVLFSFSPHIMPKNYLITRVYIKNFNSSYIGFQFYNFC